MKLSTALIVLLAWTLTFEAALHQATADDRTHRFLSDYWVKSPTAISESLELYNEMVQGGIRDDRAYYAYVLVKIKQSKFRDAYEATDQLSDPSKQHPKFLLSKAWLATMTRNYSEGLGLIGHLSEQIERQPLDKENLDVAARLVGFYSYPIANRVDSARLNLAIERMEASLTQEQKVRFQAKIKEVKTRFETLVGQRETEMQLAAEDAQQEREEKLTQLENAKERHKSNADELQFKRDKVKEEGNKKLERIREKDSPIVTALSTLQASNAQLETELSNNTFELVLLQQRLDELDDDDTNLRNRILLDMDFWNRRLITAEASLARVREQMRFYLAERQRLQAEYAATERRYQAEVHAMDKDLDELDKSQKKLDAQSDRTSRTLRPKRRQSQILTAQATALTTYVDFPAEAERRRLLNRSTGE